MNAPETTPTLAECEDGIKRSLIQSADYMRTIREHRLYTQAGIDNWDNYCTDRLGISKRRADQIILAGEVQAELGTIVPNLTLNEAQARALAPIRHDADYMAEIVAEVAAEGPVTAAAITSKIEQRRAEFEALNTSIRQHLIEIQQGANTLWNNYNSSDDPEVRAACMDGIRMFSKCMDAVVEGDLDTLFELAGGAAMSGTDDKKRPRGAHVDVGLVVDRDPEVAVHDLAAQLGGRALAQAWLAEAARAIGGQK